MKIPAIIFCFALAGDVLALVFNLQELHNLLKPLLMPLLMAFVLGHFSTGPKPILWLFLTGLFFAWAGDIFLLLEKNNPGYFLAGLGSFLCTHIFYILMFGKINGKFPIQRKALWATWTGIAVYGISLLILLWPALSDMKIPVLVYALCICTMAILSVSTPVTLAATTRVLLISGAFLFVLSDSILAINKFLGAGVWASPAIMLTYGLAQLAIAAGVSNLPKSVYGEASTPGV